MANVLIAEDDLTFRLLVEGLLHAAGHQAVSVKDGHEALEALERQHFDALVTDIVMPNMDGLELIRMMKRTRPSLIILAISGAGNASSGMDYMPAAAIFGAAATVAKREVAQRLIPALEALLAGS